MQSRLVILVGAAALALVAAPVVSASEPEPVTINVAVVLSGNLEASTTVGSFSMAGALMDGGGEMGSGWFAGQGHLRTGYPNSLHSTMRLAGSAGTITVDLVGQFGQLPAPLATGDGRWVIADATGDYASLAGRGTWSAVADFRDAIAHTGPPRVTFTLTGSVN